MESLRLILAERVRTLRQKKGWTQEELGKAAGLGPKYVSVIERGVKTPSFEAIEKLAGAFGVQGYELFVPRHRRTAAVEKEIDTLLTGESRLDERTVEEFLKGLRALLRRLDRTRPGETL